MLQIAGRSVAAPAMIVVLGLATSAHAYPGGTPYYVTDVAPFCASCHSSVSADQFSGVPPQRVQAELADGKHLSKIRAATEGSPYAKLSDAQRGELIADVQKIDAASSVKVAAPTSLKAGQVFEVTITAVGGGGPVVGIALVDSNQRWQARPASAAGFHVLDTPKVLGSDGQPQTRFTDARDPALSPGVTYVNVYDVVSSPGQGKFPTVSVTYQLRAPAVPGSYGLGAAFLYGTEKGARNGAVETLRGVQPVGGFTGNGGRVLFSEIVALEVE